MQVSPVRGYLTCCCWGYRRRAGASGGPHTSLRLRGVRGRADKRVWASVCVCMQQHFLAGWLAPLPPAAHAWAGSRRRIVLPSMLAVAGPGHERARAAPFAHEQSVSDSIPWSPVTQHTMRGGMASNITAIVVALSTQLTRSTLPPPNTHVKSPPDTQTMVRDRTGCGRSAGRNCPSLPTCKLQRGKQGRTLKEADASSRNTTQSLPSPKPNRDRIAYNNTAWPAVSASRSVCRCYSRRPL